MGRHWVKEGAGRQKEVGRDRGAGREDV